MFTSNAFRKLILFQFKNLACDASSSDDLGTSRREMKHGFFAVNDFLEKGRRVKKENKLQARPKCITMNSTLSPVIMSLSPAEAYVSFSRSKASCTERSPAGLIF